jgi:hypothetical protein
VVFLFPFGCLWGTGGVFPGRIKGEISLVWQDGACQGENLIF